MEATTDGLCDYCIGEGCEKYADPPNDHRHDRRWREWPSTQQWREWPSYKAKREKR